MTRGVSLLLAASALLVAVVLPSAALAASHHAVVAQASPGTGGGGAAETGPPWTYQMARIGVALLVIGVLAVAAAYRHFVVKPQRELMQERARQRRDESPS